MKITFLGNFYVSFSSENHHALSLESLGHDVVKLQENRATTQTILNIALKGDLFIWVHTHGWETKGSRTLKEVFNILRASKIPTISYHLDLYMGIERWNEYKDSELFDIDYFFTVDPQMAKWLNENTRVKGHFMPAGVYDKECYLVEVIKPAKDIAFIGSRGYHEEWPWRHQLIDWLKETYGDKFEHWGGDGKGVIRGRQLNILYAATKIIIGEFINFLTSEPCSGFDFQFVCALDNKQTLGMTLLEHRIAPNTFSSMSYFHVSSETVSKTPAAEVPALLIRMSTRPWASATFSNSESMSAWLVMSAGTVITSPPVAASISWAAFARFSGRLAHITTFTPSWDRLMAAALPIPSLAPVITATLPVSPISMRYISSRLVACPDRAKHFALVYTIRQEGP